jgi:hypothetical protein
MDYQRATVDRADQPFAPPPRRIEGRAGEETPKGSRSGVTEDVLIAADASHSLPARVLSKHAPEPLHVG